jgi:hypothetical protein
VDLFPAGWVRGTWGWLIIWLASVVVFALLVMVFGLADVHSATGLTADRIGWYGQEQCERVLSDSFLVQFANFWSNFVYSAVGLMIFLRSNVNHGRFVGIMLIFLAIGSGWFHGTLSEFGQTLDIAGVYAVLLAIAAYGFIEMVPITDPVPIWLIMGGATALGVVAGFLRGDVGFFDSDWFTPFLVIIIVGYMGSGLFRPSAAAKREALVMPLVLTVGLGLLGLLAKYTDGTDNGLLANHGGVVADCLYGPGSPIQGHAFWHILAGGMFLGMFEFFSRMGGRTVSVLPWRQ